MNLIRKAWLTQVTDDLCSLTIESAHPTDEKKLVVNELSFPAVPTPDHPLRHTINLGLISIDDLLGDAIQDYLDGLWEK